MTQRIQVSRGLDLPIDGVPSGEVRDGAAVRRVAILGDDFVGMKPTMAVREGDDVVLGQEIFSDKKTPGVIYTSPATGKIAAIHRGARRALQSVVIEVSGAGNEGQITFDDCKSKGVDDFSSDDVRQHLVTSGLWVALRVRPYSRVPAPAETARSIFVTAIDTRPLAVDPQVAWKEHRSDFELGLRVLSKLTEGKIFLCKAPNSEISAAGVSRVEEVEFGGPHPAGLPGTHIHFLDPVGPNKSVWHVGYQDVIAFGKLYSTGSLWVDRIVSVAGPAAKEPQIVRTRLGASTEDLTTGGLKDGEVRVVSGSVLSGHPAAGPLAFLG
ncbi:MAG: NADH:ubiquinone reductase (Na(+)-transporting) subunit A, partial [Planctomycetota bacterium]